MYKLLYPFVFLLKKSKALSSLSCRLTWLTGKTKYPIHPKHLIEIGKPWYLKDIKKEDVILDLGCGNGQHCLKTALKSKKVVGVDNNCDQLKIAISRAKEKKVENIQFVEFDLEKKLAFEKNSFDKLLCLDTLEHLRNRRQLLQEAKRVLKPKGMIFLAVPNKNTSWKNLQTKVGLNCYADPDHKIEYSLLEFKKNLSQAGFKILDVESITYDTPWVGLIDLIGGFSLSAYKNFCLWKKNKLKNNIDESTGFRIKAINLP